MFSKSKISIFSLFLLLADQVLADGARNYLSVVGSSSLMPFSEVVSDRITKTSKVKRPKLESTGTSGGFTLFCEGVGMEYPDIVNAGRRIKPREFDLCREHGVTDMVEVKVGYDGVVLATGEKNTPWKDLSRKDLYLALAKQVPDPTCKRECNQLVPNPYRSWRQINPSLPDRKIEIYGPTASASLRDILNEVVMESGCADYPWIAKRARNEGEYHRLCDSFREDGAYIEETEERRLLGLAASPDALALFSYGWLKRHDDRITPLTIEGITPDDDSIADQRYPIARPMFFYIKKAHIDRVPGFSQYIAELTSDKAWGEKGYLVKLGLIPLRKDERLAYAADAKALKTMTIPDLPTSAKTAHKAEETATRTP